MKLSNEQIERILQKARSYRDKPTEDGDDYFPMNYYEPMDLANSYIAVDRSGKSILISFENGTDYEIFPAVYVPKGKNFVRFYRDCAGQYLRTFQAHKVGSYFVSCPNPLECEVCKRAIRIPQDWQQRSDYRRREIGVAYAWLESFKKRPPYVKLREHVLLWGYEEFSKQFRAIIDDLRSRKAAERFFDPQENHKFITVKHDVEFLRVTMDWSTSFTGPIPALPVDAPPLSTCMWPADQPPDPQQVARFMKKMAKDCERKRDIPRTRYVRIDGEWCRV